MDDNLTLLGQQVEGPVRKLETIEMSMPMMVRMDVEHFTSRCPVTGQPDYASIQLEFFGQRTVETKSLKLYLESFREEGIFGERMTARIATDLQAALDPSYLLVRTRWAARGGIAIEATVSLGDEPGQTA